VEVLGTVTYTTFTITCWGGSERAGTAREGGVEAFDLIPMKEANATMAHTVAVVTTVLARAATESFCTGFRVGKVMGLA
jgi:hypothetical protein